MTPDQYLKHWEAGRIWEHNTMPHHKRRFAFIASHLEGQRFLDCGCAFGHSTFTLSGLHPGEWEGLDFSESGIAKARALWPLIKFHYAPHFAAISTIGRFDSVVCSEVLEHVNDDEGLVEALMGIADKVLLITTPCLKVDDPGHIRIYTRDTLSQLFDGYSFDISEEKPFFYAVVKHDRH